MASRGVDTTKARHVILYDFPYSAIDYLHRVGRTARAGSEGKATSFVGRKDKILAIQIQVSECVEL
jgi:superfamily II DNA/RNA helicase